LTEETLNAIKDNLTSAETSLRLGNAKSVIYSHMKLAEHFEAQQNYQIAVHFYKKCQDISQQLPDLEAEGRACESLGKCYEKVGDVLRATQYFEDFLELSRKNVSRKDQILACNHLVKVYLEHAETCISKAEYDQAVVSLLLPGDSIGDSIDWQ
jgi:tetratricopeptide (TPR) repeat protein